MMIVDGHHGRTLSHVLLVCASMSALAIAGIARAGDVRTVYAAGDVRVEVEQSTSRGMVIHLRSSVPEKIRDSQGVLVANPVGIGIGKGTLAVATRPPAGLDPAGIRIRKEDPSAGIVDAVEPSEFDRFATEFSKELLTEIPKFGIVFGMADKVGEFIQAASPQANPDAAAFHDPAWMTHALVWDAPTVSVTRAGLLPDHVLLDVDFQAAPGDDAVVYLYFQTWTRDTYSNNLSNMQVHEVWVPTSIGAGGEEGGGNLLGAWYVEGPDIPDGSLCLIFCEGNQLRLDDYPCADVRDREAVSYTRSGDRIDFSIGSKTVTISIVELARSTVTVSITGKRGETYPDIRFDRVGDAAEFCLGE